MDNLRGIRKAKGLTMEQLAKASGVSAKTVSLYENTPPKRPSRKVVEKLCAALDVSPDKLMKTIGVKEKQAKKNAPLPVPEEYSETIELDDTHVVRMLVLIEKELADLHQVMMETADLAEDHPWMGRCVEYIAGDIELLMEIKQRLC